MREKLGVKRIVAVDLLTMEPVEGVEFVQGDFTSADTQRRIRELLPTVDVICSDMLMNTSGHRDTDHTRSMQLVEAALAFAESCGPPLPTLLAKYYRGPDERELLERCRRMGYASVRSVKPEASRAESREMYLLAMLKAHLDAT